MIKENYFTPDEILQGNDALQLFKYTQEEVDDFTAGFNPLSIKNMHDSVSKALAFQPDKKDLLKINNIMNLVRTLTSKDLEALDKVVQEFTESNPNMLWNMLHTADKEYYKTPDKFYDWLGTLSDDKVDETVYRVADGLKIHSDDIYIVEPTRVRILDGYIAISSSNLDALDRFKERVLRNNDCSFEHRIKKHGDVTIHSYLFKMDNK
tara:strand:- start:2010 stop:2633 length:624 start_codon:yes stop_codon:yes gene_type:complete